MDKSSAQPLVTESPRIYTFDDAKGPEMTLPPTQPQPSEADPNATMRTRLRGLIAARRTSAQQVSLQAGGSFGLVRDILSGKTKDPKAGTLERIAEVLRTDVAYLMGNHDYVEPDPPVTTVGQLADAARKPIPVPRRRLPPTLGVRRVPVVGLAEAGVFRSIPLDWRSKTTIEALPMPEAAEAQHFALALPNSPFRFGIEGSKTYAICARSAAPVRDGVTYAIMHRLDGGPAEVSLRRAWVRADHVELLALNPDVPEDRQALRAGLDLDADETKAISIVGIAYAVHTMLSDTGWLDVNT